MIRFATLVFSMVAFERMRHKLTPTITEALEIFNKKSSSWMLSATCYFIGAVLFCAALILTMAEITTQLDEFGSLTWNMYLTSFLVLTLLSLAVIGLGYGIMNIRAFRRKPKQSPFEELAFTFLKELQNRAAQRRALHAGESAHAPSSPLTITPEPFRVRESQAV